MAIHWGCIAAGALFVGWTHAHTDEVPVVLGFILILSVTLAAAFPRRPWMTGLLIGSPVFVVETLAEYSLIRVPYHASSGLPWEALVALIPAMGGAFLGAAVRHLNRESNAAG